MDKIKKSGYIPKAVFLILAVFVGVILILNFKNPSKAMRELPIGSTYDQLISVAGHPDYVTDGTVDVKPEFKKSAGQLIPGCVKEVWYEYYLSFVPSKYSFCFDKNDILIHKYHWSSW
ncbi:hypothetical protein [Microbulbifer thermotolerans]|uniref:hypothetical protein n=1 Tax=Microbulbifer thermotolerans TaxID=252514 RepID=UPI002248CB1B|nr:hypothetical protein [Microbulbifer thermotolerans]MCX2833154.1 hypothetical protein [Microbulbifer thermotolerans]